MPNKTDLEWFLDMDGDKRNAVLRMIRALQAALHCSEATALLKARMILGADAW